MAKGMGHVVIWHVPVIVRFHRKRRVNATQLLHGKDLGNENLFGFRIKTGQARKLRARCLHGVYTFFPPVLFVFAIGLTPVFCGFIHLPDQFLAKLLQFSHAIFPILQTGIRRKRGGIVIDATVDGV